MRSERYTPTDTPLLAANMCHDMSARFAAHCYNVGVSDVMVLYVVGLKRAPFGHYVERINSFWWKIQGHWVVWLPAHNIAVDWTARQFWPDAAYPAVLTKKELADLFCELDFPYGSGKLMKQKGASP